MGEEIKQTIWLSIQKYVFIAIGILVLFLIIGVCVLTALGGDSSNSNGSSGNNFGRR